MVNHENPITIAIIGHENHGKTTLITAVSKYLSQDSNSQSISYETFNSAIEVNVNGCRINISQLEYERNKFHFTVFDCPKRMDYIKYFTASDRPIDGAILVIDPTEGPMPQTREHINLASLVKVPSIVVFLNVMEEEPEDILFIEEEVKEVLTAYGFPGNSIRIIRGSALKAINGDTEAIKSVKDVVETISKTCAERSNEIVSDDKESLALWESP